MTLRNIIKCSVLVCAIVHATAFDRKADIYNGLLAVNGLYPYVVTFESPDSDVASFCSGSIIGPKHILTAATCAPHLPSELETFQVIAGCVDLETSLCQKFKVAQVVVHPEWLGGKHEIAILILTEEISDHENTQIIPLRKETLATNKEKPSWVTRTGWANGKMYFAEVRTVTDEQCKKHFAMDVPVELFCTESAYSGWASFGGPVVYDNEQVGIVQIGNSGSLDVHLRTEMYNGFIESVLLGNEEQADEDAVDVTEKLENVDEQVDESKRNNDEL